MRNVIFDGIKSWDDLGLFLNKLVTVPPTAKRMTVSTSDINGVLDFTKGSAEKVKYSTKIITCTFVKQDYEQDWDEYFAELRRKLHGKYMNVLLSDDAEYYQDAFVTLTSTVPDGNIATVIVKIEAQPYELKTTETEETVTATSDGVTVTCSNGDMDVIPVFTTTGTVNITFNDEVITFDGSGDHESADIVFVAGDNELLIKGNDVSVTISYREGRL